ncbi:biotin--[acetyl-CoA-carboxylase] ligase [Parapedobacter sp. SGR-10]|uniref:biotin--[acetyl-CoA-carboxylase] ligase n=1 Tax=Parapedobacter sp. SGR-10 TaxID=2710879 RepID=UPI0013D1E589|nr:biotin--[acetyl-CoA-carboxylase] ligase [Parapedobacter sp. SGR-10]NGF55494.1 biotin--[acetyl-CoA-carboxylase] ligase [Parapedobacter sp. SGR-10]
MQNNTIFGYYQPYHLIVLNKVASTNDYLKQLLSNFKPLPSWTAIMAKMQTEGRGQRGTSWVTKPGQNLTASIYVKLENIDVSRQFLLTAMASLAVCDTVRSYIPDKKVCIKWPNDIYIDSQKVCGILIENKISGNKLIASIMGIGLNVAQTDFHEELCQKATSLKLAGATDDLSLVEVLHRIRARLKMYEWFLVGEQQEELLREYNDRLFQRDEICTYQLKGDIVQGWIRGVEEDGLLQIFVDGEMIKCDLKEIAYRL